MKKVLEVLNKLEFLGIDVNDFYNVRFYDDSISLQGRVTQEKKNRYVNHVSFDLDSSDNLIGYITINEVKVNIILTN